MEPTRTLVVTGDDFGSSVGANRAIEDSHIGGVLTAASLMVTGEAATDATHRAKGLPELSMGLHLVLCDGTPASDPARIPDLVGDDGRFPSDPARMGFSLWRNRHRVKQQLDVEIREQCERFAATGLPFDHIDGHHHLHMHPLVFSSVVDAMARYRVKRIRVMHEDRLARRGGEKMAARFAVSAHALLARSHRPRLVTRAIVACERTYGLRQTGCCDEDWWLWLLPRLRASRVEIYAHPDDERADGQLEKAALCSARVRDAIRRAGYRLDGVEAAK